MNKPRILAVVAVTLALAGTVHASAASPQAAGAIADAPVQVAQLDLSKVQRVSAQAVQARMSDSPVRAAAPGRDVPIYSQLLGAGSGSLQLDKSGKQNARAEAPLPGAIWLFGSALLAFLCIAGRRRL
jgi:hypothetical protein